MVKPTTITALLTLFTGITFGFMTSACESDQTNQHNGSESSYDVTLMTLNPGHFHAALVQKNMISGVNPDVYIFAPEGDDLTLHQERIDAFNTRDENPANWNLNIHAGPDYFDAMLSERPGNVMVTAGNNRMKTDYILQAVNEGIHVLSDKPMAIDAGGWQKLKEAFRYAEERDVLLYDIMTERYEVTSRIQRILAQNRDLFGELATGDTDNPAVVKESIHHLYKIVSGQPLRRPPWYFDVTQQGEGIVDVTTHLVDLSLWGAFPDEPIYYESDIEMTDARRWPTILTRQQFENITGHAEFPDYLQDQLQDGELPYYSNGEINFTLRGHHVRVSVEWAYEAPPGGNDTHYSEMRGTTSNLIIRQGADQGYKSTLFVEPAAGENRDDLRASLELAVENLQDEFPGTELTETENGWQLNIPDVHYLGHEAHFGKVAEAYFGYLQEGELPAWEVPNMITKYYITTMARELAMEN
ncbi:MAG: Gfo/Idh/MocA family oxidoreductase [Balneolaceae bacterium]|nr:Gfo/Idh/MocA family oxidoreductase [Balneolaceae bacterium]